MQAECGSLGANGEDQLGIMELGTSKHPKMDEWTYVAACLKTF